MILRHGHIALLAIAFSAPLVACSSDDDAEVFSSGDVPAVEMTTAAPAGAVTTVSLAGSDSDSGTAASHDDIDDDQRIPVPHDPVERHRLRDRAREPIEHEPVVGIPLVDARAKFMLPAKFGDLVEMHSNVGEFRRSSFNVEHRMLVDGKEYRFSAVSTAPRFLEVTGRACALPEAGDDSSASADDMPEPHAATPEPDALKE